MTAFRRSAESLAAFSPMEDQLGKLISEHVRHSEWVSPSPAEVRSWNRSIPVLAQDLVDADLGGVEVLLEYRLPLSSKRVDAVLAGIHPETGADSYVVVELKQWSHAESWEDDPEMVLLGEHERSRRLHPVLQVRHYCEYIADFVSAVENPGRSLRGVAYLHNASDADVSDLFELPQDDYGRLFTRQRRGGFLDFLRSRLAPKPGAAAADRFLDSAWRPSRNLMNVAAKEIKEREQFVLLDEQQTAYQTVLHAVKRSYANDSKRVVVISGGPGSGKSVIALSLLGELNRQGYRAVHATGAKSFTETMRKVAAKGAPRLKKLFVYFNSFMEASPNDLDVLICDEAHRIRETSANRFTRASLRTGRPQIDELVSAARVPVFLLDEHQVVRPDETGTVAMIREFAESRGLKVEHISLDGQFRCGGSAKYERWVLRLLGLDPGGPTRWEHDDHFHVEVTESPEEMERILRSRLQEGYSARISAGYCWKWSKPENGRLVDDVVIGDWARPWNSRSDRTIGGAPPSSLWATAEGGFDQVGCVYTAQGFEYDWSGVIFGPDLVFRDGRLVIDRSQNRDPSLTKKTEDVEAEALIRNIYKVLLTRGMRGTVLYSTDTETRAFLRELVAC